MKKERKNILQNTDNNFFFRQNLFFYCFFLCIIFLLFILLFIYFDSYVVAEYIFAGCGATSAFLCILLMASDANIGDGLLYASSGRIRRVLAKRVKLKRRERKAKRRRKERALLMDRSGYGTHKKSDGTNGMTESWQSTIESSIGSPNGSLDGDLSPRNLLLSPRTATEIKSDYFKRLDILLRRKGGLS